MRILLGLAVIFLLASCGTEMWLAQGTSRPAVTAEKVTHLEQLPKRSYTVIGIITPPAGEYETFAEAVKGMRKEAAKHGADAFFFEWQTADGGWRFVPGGWGRSGTGNFDDQIFRAKAIVWK